MIRRILMVLACAPTALACTGGVAIEDLPQEQGELFCDTLSTCFGRIADRLLPVDCAGVGESSVRNNAAAVWDALIEAGTISYNAGAASQCLAALEALGCDSSIEAPPPVCRDVFTGHVELGGECTIDEECAGDAFCDAAGCPTVAGTCRELFTSGTACVETSECEDELVCENLICRSPGSSRDGMCEGGSGLVCPLDQICVGAAVDTPGTCTDVAEVFAGEEGETCNIDMRDFCSPDLSCAVTGLGATGPIVVCVAIASSGGSCNPAAPSMCPRGEFCDELALPLDITGVCTPRPTAGQPCESEPPSLAPVCAEGLVCVPVGGVATCSIVRDNGDACEVNQQCFSGNCDAGTCAPPAVCLP